MKLGFCYEPASHQLIAHFHSKGPMYMYIYIYWHTYLSNSFQLILYNCFFNFLVKKKTSHHWISKTFGCFQTKREGRHLWFPWLGRDGPADGPGGRRSSTIGSAGEVIWWITLSNIVMVQWKTTLSKWKETIILETHPWNPRNQDYGRKNFPMDQDFFHKKCVNLMVIFFQVALN